jgi:dihydroflavonol-4-reductase
MKRTLVTGATGFLGRQLVRELRQTDPDIPVRVLCRHASPWDLDTDIEIVRGDVTYLADALAAAAGVNEIYHLAGIVSRNPADQETLYRTHIEGTRNVCEAAWRHNVGKLVVASSSGTIAVGREPVTYDESSGFKNEVVARWPYYLSKIFAEKVAWDYIHRNAAPIVIVSPSLILGPGDSRQSSTGDIRLFLEGQILAVPRGGVSFVDVRDAAAGFRSAMRRGRPGQRYLLAGASWTFRELIETVSRISGRRAPRLHASEPLSLLSARLLRRLFPVLGKQFRLDDASIQMASYFWYCDSEKARAELGFQTRDPVITLRDTVEYVRQSSNSNMQVPKRKIGHFSQGV